MKRKIIYSCLTLFIILQGCKKDTPVTQPARQATDTTTLSLAAARNWFNNQPAPSAGKNQNSASQTFSLRKLTVAWDKVTSNTNAAGNYWLAATGGSPTIGKYLTGYRKIAFFKTGNHAVTARILEIIPDGLYLQLKQKATTADFTGRLFIYDTNYHLLGGKIFSGGKLAGEIKPQKNQTQNNTLHTDNMQTITACEWHDSNYINAEGELVIYSEQVCTDTTIDDGQGDFDGGTGDYLGNESGGGATSSTAPPVSNLPGENGPGVNPKSLMDCFGNIPDAGARCTACGQGSFRQGPAQSYIIT
ncbi:hypothetical protein [Mucilaginibacter sp. L3T2-6]|uniref:hypothetical protein n=1 Tax=Mucilaginibacter sp. L3T2-6 TaxID=3062491 RepID=UPI002675A50C|nr:hypothetical protein [Mucilaginibacter sp. L3T2-6]MDO3641338.1 hypothetical protein [Mucilaginibacter sp. L3T2-6]MDV6213901.1 hypothetical protein [Mucilaginibacter sp. L3T2-6]